MKAGIIWSNISALAECYESVNLDKCSRCSGGFSSFIYCNDFLCPLAPSSVVVKCGVLIYDDCHHLKRTKANLINVSVCRRTAFVRWSLQRSVHQLAGDCDKYISWKQPMHCFLMRICWYKGTMCVFYNVIPIILGRIQEWRVRRNYASLWRS